MPESLYQIPVARIDGQPTSLAEFQGKVLLVVNVASKCGLTPQYAGLQSLYERKHAAGFEILGFPANDSGDTASSQAPRAMFYGTSRSLSLTARAVSSPGFLRMSLLMTRA